MGRGGGGGEGLEGAWVHWFSWSGLEIRESEYTQPGDPRQTRRANARALALAELTRKTRAEPRLRRGHAAIITALAFHPDRRRLFSAP